MFVGNFQGREQNGEENPDACQVHVIRYRGEIVYLDLLLVNWHKVIFHEVKLKVLQIQVFMFIQIVLKEVVLSPCVVAKETDQDDENRRDIKVNDFVKELNCAEQNPS